MHKFDVKNMSKLDNAKRRSVLPPKEILQRLDIGKDEVFVDVGCGIGYFSAPAARIAGPDSVVYALDISSEMLAVVEEKALQEGLQNIQTVKNEEYDLVLEDAEATIVFSCNVLHEVEDKLRFLGEMKRILKPGGRMVIIEWEKEEADYGPPMAHRVSKETVQSLLESLGLEEFLLEPVSGYFYMLTARRTR